MAVLRHEPQRQCAGCGQRAAQARLVRLTLKSDDVPPSVVVAGGGQHRGRSAYVCPKRGCFDRALQRKAFNRAFRQTVVVDVDGIVAVLEKGSTVAQENDTAGG